MTLHFSQIFLTLALTFMALLSSTSGVGRGEGTEDGAASGIEPSGPHFYLRSGRDRDTESLCLCG